MGYKKSDPLSTVGKVIKTAEESIRRANERLQKGGSNKEWDLNQIKSKAETIAKIAEKAKDFFKKK